MSTENVKIVIQENDLTTAQKLYTSSDVVFIPGFSVLATAPTVPVLCNTLHEFTNVFGNKPKQISSAEASTYTSTLSLNITAGEDKSYIYATELLKQNVPVVYCVLSPSTETSYSITSVSDDKSSTDFKEYTTVSLDSQDIVIAKDPESDDDSTTFDRAVITLSSNTSLGSNKAFGVVATKPHLNCSFIPYVYDSADNLVSPETYELDSYSTYSESRFEFSFGQDVTVSNYKLKFDLVLTDITITEDNPYIFPVDIKVVTASSNKNNDIDTITDRNDYNVKYITSGGYASFYRINDTTLKSTFATNLLNYAKTRGDCIALIDYECTNTRDVVSAITGNTSIYKDFNDTFKDTDIGKFGAAYYPWAYYTCQDAAYQASTYLMPASFGYLMSMAKSTKTNPNWLAIAGVSRGLVPNIESLYCKNNMISNNIAEQLQPKYGGPESKISVNCITNIRPYGLTIWGNRTLLPQELDASTRALNFVNIRNMISDIKKLLYSSAKSLMFEQNTDDTWLRFKSLVTPLLGQLKTGSAISDYKIIRSNTRYDGTPLVNGEVAATIRIYPMFAIEYFELTVELSNQDITIS